MEGGQIISIRPTSTSRAGGPADRGRRGRRLRHRQAQGGAATGVSRKRRPAGQRRGRRGPAHLPDPVQNNEQRARLLELRQTALAVMREFEDHAPYLTGPAWKGTAARGAGVDINLFTDLEKQVEMQLLSGGIAYATSERSHFNRSLNRRVPVFSFEVDDIPVHLIVYKHSDERGAARADASGNTDRGNLTAVELLIDEEEQTNTVEQFLANIR